MRRTWRFFLLAAVLGCNEVQHTANTPNAPSEQSTPSSPSVVSAPANDTPPPAQLPVLGDPYGLLTRQPEQPVKRATPPSIGQLDPGALSARNAFQKDSTASLERDPRAVERASAALAPSRPKARFSAEVRDISASEVISDVHKGRGFPQVLFLYAAYCQYCRSAMAPFLELSQRYQQSGVRFTAASVDTDLEAFTNYAPVLGGLFPAWRVLPQTGMGRQLKELGVALKDSGNFGIPLFAVLDRRQHVVSQGASVERMARSLDGLLAK